jgi:hypothetical protein
VWQRTEKGVLTECSRSTLLSGAWFQSPARPRYAARYDDCVQRPWLPYLFLERFFISSGFLGQLQQDSQEWVKCDRVYEVIDVSVSSVVTPIAVYSSYEEKSVTDR